MFQLIEYLPGLACVVAFTAALIAFTYFYKKRILHPLILAVSLMLYGLGTFSEFIAGLSNGWSIPLYKFYYAISPIQVGLLGAGAIYQLNRRYARIFLLYVLIIALIISFKVPFVNVNANLLNQILVGGSAMPSDVRMFSPLLTIPGGLIFVLGSLIAYLKNRARKYGLIFALSGVTVMVGGFGARYGVIEALYSLELLGIILILVGEVVHIQYIKSKQTVR